MSPVELKKLRVQNGRIELPRKPRQSRPQEDGKGSSTIIEFELDPYMCL